eukprot:gene4645-4897_t
MRFKFQKFPIMFEELQPAVAFANIGELAVDVLICTLKAVLIARLDDDNILACVGNNAFSPQPAGLLATALELYQIPGSKVYLLQQRAPAICGRQQAFADNSYQLAGCLCLEQDVVATEREVHALLPPWPLLDAAAKAGLQHSLLTTFAAEGDNEQDALSLAEKVLQVLQGQALLPVATQEQHIGFSLQVPCSWKGLYGERPVDLMLV